MATRPVQAPRVRKSAPSKRPLSRRALLGGAIGLAVVAAGVLVLVTALGGKSSKPSAAQPVVGGAETSALLAGIPQHGNALGSPKAPVTLVEFADPQCPYCGDWARGALPDLVRQYVRAGKVRVVFNGMSFVGPDSELALRTALAAGQQNRLWNVLDLLYRNQGTENTGWVTQDLLAGIGASVPGLDSSRMLAQRNTPEVTAAMAAAANDANAHGINSTPSFLAGRTGGTLQPVKVTTLDLAGIAPALDQLLAQ
jgi:protein-disulfide isomerase